MVIIFLLIGLVSGAVTLHKKLVTSSLLYTPAVNTGGAGLMVFGVALVFNLSEREKMMKLL